MGLEIHNETLYSVSNLVDKKSQSHSGGRSIEALLNLIPNKLQQKEG